MASRGIRRNIGGDENDKNYRYTMPCIKCKEEGKGNGVRTVILNMKDIAKDLKIPPEYPTKWFGFDLGSISKYDPKRGFASVNGIHPLSRLDKSIDQFINLYILCPNCHLPETDIYVKKEIIKQGCRACGYNGNVDMTHKLSKAILANPPIYDKPIMKDKTVDTKSGQGSEKLKTSKKSSPSKKCSEF